MASILGIGLGDASSIRWKWSTHTFRERARRTGIFERLAADGVLSPLVDWDLVADGRYTAHGPFARGEPLKRILANYGPIVEDELTERRRQLARAGGSAGDGLAVRDLKIGELRNLSPDARRLMRRRARRGCGGGADAIAELGEDLYVEHVDAIAADATEACMKLARNDRHPARRLDAWLADNAIPQTKLIAVPPAWIAGRRWKVYGLRARIDGDDLLLDDRRFELDGLDRVPVKWGSVQLPRVAPRISTPVPF